MPKTYHTATHGGQTFTRESASRTYTHVTLGRPCADYGLRYQVESEELARQDGRNYDYYQLCASGKGPHTHGTPQQKAAQAERMRVQALEELGGAATREDFQAARLGRRRAAWQERVDSGYYGRWQDLGWLSREDLARKNAASHRNKAPSPYAEIAVVECERSDRPPPRKRPG